MRLPFDAIDRGANMLFLEVATGVILAALCMRTPILLMIGGCFVGWAALVRLGLLIWLSLAGKARPSCSCWPSAPSSPCWRATGSAQALFTRTTNDGSRRNVLARVPRYFQFHRPQQGRRQEGTADAPGLLSLTKAERAVVRRSLHDRRSLLLEKIGDTAEACRTHEAAQRELDAIASVLAKMKNR